MKTMRYPETENDNRLKTKKKKKVNKLWTLVHRYWLILTNVPY